MSAWDYMGDAPLKGEILLNLGDTLPGVPDIRVGSWISQSQGREMGEELPSNGGWLIWNDDADWFVLGFQKPKCWAAIPK